MATTAAPTFGRKAEDDRPDLTPQPFHVVGYDNDGVEHKFTFHARASVPMGSLMSLLEGVDGKGTMDTGATMRFLTAIILTDEVDEWKATLDRQDVAFDADMLAELGEYFGEKYMNRPLARRSVKRAGRARTSTTSGARSR